MEGTRAATGSLPIQVAVNRFQESPLPPQHRRSVSRAASPTSDHFVILIRFLAI